MTETLSQDEIDALLTAISSGEIEGGAPAAVEESGGEMRPVGSGRVDTERRRKIKTYDFKRPDKFSKDQIRTLQMMHEAFARLATTALSARLRAMVHVHVGSVDQLTYEEFIKSIPSPTTLAVIDMAPLKGNAIFEIDPSITFAMIDRLFGGKGQPANITRELTDIERSVIERIVLRILNDLKEAWSNVVDLRPRLGAMESNPQFVQVVPPNDMIVLITLETRVHDVEGLTNLCIPYITIEPILSKLSAQYWYSSIRRGASADALEAVRKRLSRTKVGVSAVLGDSMITVKEVLSLKKGDVIRLNTHMNQDSLVMVGSRAKFRCRPGVVGLKKAVRVTEVLKESFSDDLSLNKGGRGGEVRYG